jgi:hypothetical protein
MKPEYGTPQFYADLFSDILGDIGDDSPVDPTDNIIAGFIMAVDSWQEYHSKAAAKYQALKDKLK